MKRIRILVADDSALAREVLRDLLERDGDIVVVAEAAGGAEAVSQVESHRPDLATIDIQMPDVDGWLATERIMARRPTPILVVTARPVDAALAFEALRRGALDLVWKPAVGDEDAGRALREKVRLLAGTPVVKHLRALLPEARTPAPIPAARAPRTAARVVAIAGSAGGPRALATILGGLPAAFRAPIAVVQHLPPGFTAAFAKFLATVTPLEVVVVGADRAAPLRPGAVYLPADDRHLIVGRGGLAVDAGPPESGFRPSASVLYRSLAQSFGSAAIGVILSGIGSDGVAGLEAIVGAGGFTISQSQESSIVYGMPRAAVAAGVSSLVLDVHAIAPLLIERCR